MADKIIIQLMRGLVFMHDSIEREGTQGINWVIGCIFAFCCTLTHSFWGEWTITRKCHMPQTLPDSFNLFPTLSDHFQSKLCSADLFSDFIALDYLVTDPLSPSIRTARHLQNLSIESFITKLTSMPAPWNSDDASTQLPQHCFGVLLVSVIWSYCEVMWSWSMSELVILLLDFICASPDIKFAL